MTLVETRYPSVYSFQQLLEGSLNASPRGPAKPGAGAEKRAVSQLVGASLPKITFGRAVSFQRKRIRSSDEQATVPDIDYKAAEFSSPENSDDELALVPSPVRSTTPEEGFLGAVGEDGTVIGSLLDSVLLAEWEDRAQQGLFRYDVTACPTKAVPGAYGFIAQFNEGRASKKRPTEFCIDQVIQKFDHSKFHFKKAYDNEVLFQFEQLGRGDGPVTFQESSTVTSNSDLVLINVSPIEYGHVLLVPRVLDDLPQLADPASTLLALRFCQQADNPFFRLCYNSLGAYATINHLHFQAYYLAATFAVERAPTAPVPAWKRRRDVSIATIEEYPVKGLVFEAGAALPEMAELIGKACHRLAAANVPHNLFVVDRGQRAFLFPNGFSIAKAKGAVPAELLDTQVDPAGFEISGHLILKRQKDFDNVTQEWVWRLLSFASLGQAEFEDFVHLALDLD